MGTEINYYLYETTFYLLKINHGHNTDTLRTHYKQKCKFKQKTYF